MLPFLVATILFCVLYRLAANSVLPDEQVGPAPDAQGTARMARIADQMVEAAFKKALDCCPKYATPLLKVRAPCLLLLARAASGDLDAMTLEIVERLRSHIPSLIAAHCASIERTPPHLRDEAMVQLVEDMRYMADLASGQLDLLATKSSAAHRSAMPRLITA